MLVCMPPCSHKCSQEEESWTEEYGKLYQDRVEVSEGSRSQFPDVGSGFVPDGELMELYLDQKKQKR